jgi:uncharacterized protein involved in exopolysaccharide biosynthesis
MDDEIFALEKTTRFKPEMVLAPRTARDVLSIAFRRRRLLIACVVATLAATILGAWLLPRYQGETKLLIMRQRVDPVLSPTPQENTFAVSAVPVVTDEELRSEVELLSSYDLAQQVVESVHPEKKSKPSPLAFLTAWTRWFSTPQEREAGAVQQLMKDMDVDVAKGSNVIVVTYKNQNPEVIKEVLDKLVQLYTARHGQIDHPSGQYNFFQQQTAEYKAGLDQAEAALANFPKQYGVVDPAASRDLVLQKLTEFQANLHQTRVSISDAQSRVQDLQAQLTRTPGRITTALKRADNPQLLQQLKSTLLDLQLKRVQLGSQFQPTYRSVQELDKQIADTKAAIQAQETQPVQEATTDIDPTHAWLRGELAKAKADLAGLQATQAALVKTVDNYEASARDLDQKAIVQHDLQRKATSEEDEYLMYLRKREQARASDVMDSDRMFNIAVAEPPTVPALPSHSPALFALVIFLFMALLSCAIFWALEYFDRTFRARTQVEAFLNVPVLAAVPYQSNGNRRHLRWHRNRAKALLPGTLDLDDVNLGEDELSKEGSKKRHEQEL